jgi:hypothetical protein
VALPPEAQRPVRHDRPAGRVDQHGLELGVFATQVGRGEEPPRDGQAVPVVEADQERQVDEALDVVGEGGVSAST